MRLWPVSDLGLCVSAYVCLNEFIAKHKTWPHEGNHIMFTTQDVKDLAVGQRVTIEEVSAVIGGGDIVEIDVPLNRIRIAQQCYYRGELVDTVRTTHFLGGFKTAVVY